jgi:membrane protease YdiL (CAAX protease family)
MNQPASAIERYALVLFCAATILLSFGIAFLPMPAEVKPFLIVLVPAVMALLLSALTGGRQGVAALLKKLTQWGVGFKWYAIALGLGLILRLGIGVLAILLGWISSIQVRAWSVPQFVTLGIILLISALPEELGWRGYALPQMLGRRSALASALLIGVLWGSVHLALTLPGMIYAGTSWLATLLELVGLSILLTWLFVQTGGNILITSLFHAAQSFFVVINEGLSLDQQLWLMAVVYLSASLVVTIIYGPNLKRIQGAISKATMSPE